MGSTSGWQTKAKAMMGMVYAVWGHMGLCQGSPPNQAPHPYHGLACQNL
jgi:hypothetical protein